MIGKKLLLILFLCLSAAQIAVPLSMIARREYVLHAGRAYRFKSAPMDPGDVLRGRYVALTFDQRDVAAADAASFAWAKKAYGVLAVDPAGFAKVDSLSLAEPTGADHIEVRCLGAANGRVSFDFPFDRYYMDETLAPAAEQAYWNNSRRGQMDTYVTVRVKGDMAVVEDLVVGGKPVRDYVREANVAAR